MSIHASPIPSLQLLKFGGSLITDKFLPSTPRMDVLERLAQEVAAVWNPQQPSRLIVGNGAGSFGHITAKKYATRQGVRTTQQWQGFAEVWREAAKLNSLVTDAFHEAGLPAIASHQAEAILAVATATAEGHERKARALSTQGGEQAMQLRAAEEYIEQFGQLAKAGNTLVVPANLGDVASMVALATRVVSKAGDAGGKGA